MKDAVIRGYQDISIHTLAWRVTRIIPISSAIPINFNPHPRVEGDFISRLLRIPNSAISIHTLAWRVTSGIVNLCVKFGISIHTLAWRVTYCVGALKDEF